MSSTLENNDSPTPCGTGELGVLTELLDLVHVDNCRAATIPDLSSEDLGHAKGAANEADLILSRADAIFIYDWRSDSTLERLKSMFVCLKHKIELGYSWWKKARITYLEKSLQAVCKINDVLPELKTRKNRVHDPSKLYRVEKRSVTKIQSEELFKQFGKLIPIGFRKCYRADLKCLNN